MVSKSGGAEPDTVLGMSGVVARLAWPTMLSRSGILVMSFVDIVMVGRYATEELAYAALGLSLFIPALVTAIGLQFGTMREVATSYGAKRLRGCGAALRRGLPWSGTTSLAAAVFVAFSGTWLTLFGQEPEMAHEAGRVAFAVSFGLPFQLLYVSCAFYLEGTRRPVPGMVIMLMANAMNIALNWVLIYGNLGMPAMGAVGSGIATSLVRVAMFAAIIAYILTRPDARAYGVFDRPGSFWGEGGWKGGREMRRVGTATSFSYFAETGAHAVVMQFAGLMGAAAIAAYSIAHNLLALLFMLSLGVASATAVLVGNAEGRDDRAGVQLAGGVGIIGSVVLMAVFGLAIAIIPEPLARLYTDDPGLLLRTAPLLIIVAAIAWADGSQVVASQAVRALGDSWPATRLQLIAWVAVFVPVAWVLGFWAGLAEGGLLIAGGIGGFVSLVFMSRRFMTLARTVADLRQRLAQAEPQP